VESRVAFALPFFFVARGDDPRPKHAASARHRSTKPIAITTHTLGEMVQQSI
jgi:hypothetical protein